MLYVVSARQLVLMTGTLFHHFGIPSIVNDRWQTRTIDKPIDIHLSYVVWFCSLCLNANIAMSFIDVDGFYVINNNNNIEDKSANALPHAQCYSIITANNEQTNYWLCRITIRSKCLHNFQFFVVSIIQRLTSTKWTKIIKPKHHQRKRKLFNIHWIIIIQRWTIKIRMNEKSGANITCNCNNKIKLNVNRNKISRICSESNGRAARSSGPR